MISAILAAGLAASRADAQVMEISPDGVVSVRDGSGEAAWTVVQGPSETTQDLALEIDVPAGALTNIDRLDAMGSSCFGRS
jgi:hypothetical protein